MGSDVISNLTAGAIYDNTMDFWNSIVAPPLLSLLTPYDVTLIDEISRDPKLKTKLDKKYQLYNQILEPRGFTRLTQGTNRVVYRFREDERFVIKLATSQAGLQDSPAEFKNQQIWLPDVAKCFEVSQSGAIGLFERVNPIRSKEQLLSIIDEVYLFYYKLFRRHASYVMADIGIEFYKNLGIRDNFGIVLLDYPLMYKIDKNKLFCDRVDRFGHICGGQIDYDDGFNFLKCTRCGKQYLMKKLAIDSGTIEEYVTKFIKRKEVSDMKVFIKRGDEVIYESRDSVINSDYINPAVSIRHQKPNPVINSTGKIRVVIDGLNDEPDTPEEVEENTGYPESPAAEDACSEEADSTSSEEEQECDSESEENQEQELKNSIEEYTKLVEEDRIDDNPYLCELISNFIMNFEEEVNALGIDVNYIGIFVQAEFDYDTACTIIRDIIDTAQKQKEEAEAAKKAEEAARKKAEKEKKAAEKKAAAEKKKAEDKPKATSAKKAPVQSAPYPPVEKQTNVSMNMEDDTFFDDGSKEKYPAKKGGKKKAADNFDNY